MARIIVVDNEGSILTVLNTILKSEDHEVETFRDGEKALETLKNRGFDLLISDIRMSPMDGMELLRKSREIRPGMAVIMLTAFGSVESAIEAMKLGAFDYVTKPFKVDELIITVDRALQYSKALSDNENLKAQLNTRYQFENIVVQSKAMHEVCKDITRVAPTNTTVLIYGESGTGKELIAKAIHSYSQRKKERFLAVNCAALPEQLLESEMFGHAKGAFTGASSEKKGLFEAAEGGTIFLDEVSAISKATQGKLLRVLQEKEIRRVGSNENIKVNARVIAATNTPLEDAVANGSFREDLYYRLNVIPIHIEPLRKRKEDIPPLIQHVIQKETPNGRPPPELHPEARNILMKYDWPGNVRELENAIKHCLTFASSSEIQPDLLPQKILHKVAEMSMGIDFGSSPSEGFMPLKKYLEEKEKEYLQRLLQLLDNDKEKAAQILQISLATLYRKLPPEEKTHKRRLDAPYTSGQ